MIDAASESVCRGCEIEDNVFRNNSKRIVRKVVDTRPQILETIRMSGKFHLSLKNNYFDNPVATYEVTMPLDDGELTNASGCYWGDLSYTNITHRYEAINRHL